MAESFKLEKLSFPPPQSRRILVTGAAGNIGSYFAEHAPRDRYTLRLMVRPGEEESDRAKIHDFGEIVECELSDLAGLKKHCEGMDVVLHLAADPSPAATWESVRDNNLTGAYNMFVAAKVSGVKRFIYASSIHAVSGYPPEVQVHTSDPVNPGDLYGVSKCFGEALARYMAEKEGLPTIVIRIGAFQPQSSARDPEGGINMLDAWVSRRDLQQLIERCIEADHVRFAIVHGLSANRFLRMDLSDTRELLGYEPQDDMTQVNSKLKNLRLRDSVRAHSTEDGEQKSGLRKEVEKLKNPRSRTKHHK